MRYERFFQPTSFLASRMRWFDSALGLVEAIGRDVGLAAEDRLDAVGLGLLVEVERAEQVAVVGDRHRLHPALEHLREQVVQADGAVEKAILRVQMQVRELGHALVLAFRTRPQLGPTRARLIQRKRIHSLSTGARSSLPRWPLARGACAGGGPSATPGGDRVLVADPADRSASARAATGSARFVLDQRRRPGRRSRSSRSASRSSTRRSRASSAPRARRSPRQRGHRRVRRRRGRRAGRRRRRVQRRATAGSAARRR